MKSAFGTKPRGRIETCSLQGGRKIQEDRVACWTGQDESLLVVLCDGAGGHGGGAGASLAAVEAAEALWKKSGKVIRDPSGFLSRWASEAHEAVNAEGARSGTSGRAVVAAAVIIEHEAHWLHAGDCRVYHLRGKNILSRTRDDSVVQVLFERGDITEEEMGNHPDQNRLLQSLGGKEAPRPQQGSATLQAGDRILLCSDGLWEFLSKKEIGLLGRPGRIPLEKQLEQAVSKSVLRAGKKADNTSAAVFLLEPAEEAGLRESERPVRASKKVLLLIVAWVLFGLAVAIVLALLFDEGQEIGRSENGPLQDKLEVRSWARSHPLACGKARGVVASKP